MGWYVQNGFPQSHCPTPTLPLFEPMRTTVRTGFGNSDWFEIGKGVRQGCVLSPQLFNVYTELIMREALGGFTGTVSLGGKICTNLRYADDVPLLAGSMEELQRLLDRVRLASEEGGLFLNVTKTKLMRVNSNRGNSDEVDMKTLMVNGEFVEEVDSFNYLGANLDRMIRLRSESA